jgi:site-specific recombinase XerD
MLFEAKWLIFYYYMGGVYFMSEKESEETKPKKRAVKKNREKPSLGHDLPLCPEFHSTLLSYWVHLMVDLGCAQNTLRDYNVVLKQFFSYLNSIGIMSFNLITTAHIKSFIGRLAEENYKPITTAHKLSIINGMFDYLYLQNKISTNPAIGIKYPKYKSPPPKFLDKNQIKKLIEQSDGNDPESLRNRAMLEVMYGTGLRISALSALTLDQLNLEYSYFTIKGRGYKYRIIPLRRQALGYLERYLVEARSKFLNPENERDNIFLSNQGKPISRYGFHLMLNILAEKAGLPQISADQLRYSFATHLVENGSELSYVQLMLGHAEIKSTKRYLNKKDQPLNEAKDPLKPQDEE